MGLVGCGSNALFSNSILVEKDGDIKREYAKFNGEFEHKIECSNDTTINVAIVTKSGSLSLKIINTDTSNSPYSGNFIEDMNFSVNVSKGKYKFLLNANEHCGSYSFTWNA